MIEPNPYLGEDLAAHEVHYWQVLQTTLKFVFEADPELAMNYRQELQTAPPLQRALALHDEPLDVASTLSGKSVNAARAALYDVLMSQLDGVEAPPHDPDIRGPRRVLSSILRDERSPMVTVPLLNKFMSELGYHPLTVRSGVAYFFLQKKSWKKPLPRQHAMETLPGLTAERESVYGLDRVLNLFNGLQEYVRRRKPESTMVVRIEKIKERLVRTLQRPH